MTARETEHHLRADRRPGLRRPAVPRQHRDPHAEPGQVLRPMRAVHRLPRRHDMRPDPLGPDDRALLQLRGRLAHHRRAVADARGRVDPPDRAARGRLSHGPFRQVAPRRRPALPPARAGLRAVDLSRRRRRGQHARLLGQRLLRRPVLRQRRDAPVRGLLHRRVLPRGDQLHRGAGGGRRAVLLLHRHQRAPRPALRGEGILRHVRRLHAAFRAGEVLRHGHEHRRELRQAPGQARRARPDRRHDPDLHDGQRHGRRGGYRRRRLRAGRQGHVQRRHARPEGLAVRGRPSRAAAHSLPGRRASTAGATSTS